VDRAIRTGTLVVVPAVVIAETTRGGPRDAPVNRVLKTVDEITPVTEATARLAGRLLAAAGPPIATIDALVVAEAVLGDAAILLTGDLKDLAALASGYPHVSVYGV
jgi:predicted nucleic acid-binding protein